jgi:hypothetical protein
LGLLDNASVSPIDIPRWYIDYEYFLKAHLLKKKENGQLVMMYLGYTNEISLPIWELGLYTVNFFLINLQVLEAAPRRSASARLTRNPKPSMTVMTSFQKDQLSPAMQVRISWDLLACTSPSMLVGSNPLLSTPKASSNLFQASSGTMVTSTTSSNSPMKKFQGATREDVCPSLLVAIMISPWAIMSSRWSTLASTPG